MPSPDLSPYIDLTLFDEDAQSVFETALAQVTTRVPGYTPRETNIEVILMEAMAFEVERSIFAINRLPGTIFDVLMKLFNVERFLGTPPITSLTFTVATTQGYTIPAGTRAVMTTDEGSIVFALDQQIVIAAGANSGTGAATGESFTSNFNGTPIGTSLSLLDAVPFVDYVTTASAVQDGADEESNDEWRARGAARFSRLTETLVLPEHFVQSALENALVTRAFAIDNFAPGALPTPSGVTATPGDTGGTLAAATYSYRVSAVNRYGETLASAAVTATTTTATSTVAVAWSEAVPVEGAAPVTAYRVYGRVGGSEGLLAEVAATARSYTDTGADVPGAAPKTTNTTAGVVGEFPGHVTVAVYGGGVLLSDAEKASIDTNMEAATAANLSTHIVDPTITDVDVTVTVKATLGYELTWVRQEVENTLREYLNPNSWLWSGQVRVNELVSVIDDSLGVEFVESITVPAADVTLPGYAPLARAGTLTVTVVA